MKRIVLTSTVKIKSETYCMLPVKTDKPIPINKIKSAMKEINEIELLAPILIGEVIVCDFIESGTNLIATKTVEK